MKLFKIFLLTVSIFSMNVRSENLVLEYINAKLKQGSEYIQNNIKPVPYENSTRKAFIEAWRGVSNNIVKVVHENYEKCVNNVHTFVDKYSKVQTTDTSNSTTPKVELDVKAENLINTDVKNVVNPNVENPVNPTEQNTTNAFSQWFKDPMNKVLNNTYVTQLSELIKNHPVQTAVVTSLVAGLAYVIYNEYNESRKMNKQKEQEEEQNNDFVEFTILVQ